MARLAALPLVLALVAGLAGCSDDPSSEGPTSTTAPVPETPPVELFVTEDLVRVTPAGIADADGQLILELDEAQRSCVATSVDDPDDEQIVAEAVVACVDFADLLPHLRMQLSDQPVLEGVDPACLDREIDSLQSQPDVLAAVLRGDENARPAVAGTMVENCSS